MRPYRAALLIVAVGLLTFGAMFALLQVTRSSAAPDRSVVPVPDPATVTSFGLRLAAGEIAVGVPTAGSEQVLGILQPGARIDVLALLPLRADGRALTAVVVKGATVLRLPSAPDPLLVKVDAADAIVLAHLIMGGTHLDFAAWATDTTPPPPMMDERTARALLGLPPVPEPTQVAPTPAPTLVPIAATPAPTAVAIAAAVPTARVGGFIYQAQDGDNWESVATTFNLLPAELRQWNEVAPGTELAPGALLFVPRR